MSGHADHGQLQDFREGLLPPEEEERVRAHLQECPACREEVEKLGSLLEELAGLPLEAEPPRDLWPQIAWRMEAAARIRGREEEGEEAEAREVRPEPAAREVRPEPSAGETRPGRRWVSLPVWQLLAASLVLALVSGGSVWLFLSGGGREPGAAAPGSPAAAQWAGLQEFLGDYEEAVAELEGILVEGRELLDPETVRVLEENLATIEGAIREAQAALARDPGSKLLQRLLAENLRRKVDLLRHAAVAVFAET